MPRNGSGTFTLASAAFVPNTTISSAAVNLDFSDIATALTDSVAADGQTPLTGQLLASAGSSAAPGYTFGTFPTNGLYAISSTQIGVAIGGVLVGIINATGFANSGGTNYVTSNPNILNNYIDGYTLSNDGVTPHTKLDIAVGQATNSTNATFIQLSSAISKSTGGLWVSGTGNFGMGIGLSVAINTWYHVFAITNTNATWNAANTDVYFDTSVSAANAPAGTTAFRRIGSFRTDGSGNILNFFQYGDQFWWTTGFSDISSNTLPTGVTTITLTVPTGVIVNAIFGFTCDYVSAGRTLGFGPTTATTIAAYANVQATSTEAGGQVDMMTNTSAQIKVDGGAGGGANYSVATQGWCDWRGKL